MMLKSLLLRRRFADSSRYVSSDIDIDRVVLSFEALSISFGNNDTRLEVGDGDNFLLDDRLEELIIRAKFLPAVVLKRLSSLTSGGLTSPKSDLRNFFLCSFFFTSIVSCRLSSFFSSLM
jgi:hypothetical protein